MKSIGMRKNCFATGIILRTAPYGEADVIGTLLTQSAGIIGFIARSARRSKKRLGGGIENLDCATFELLAPNKSDGLHEMVSITDRVNWASLRSSTTFFCIACLLAEISLLLCKTDEDSPQFFSWITENLHLFNQPKTQIETLSILAQAQLSALRIAGLDPEEHPGFPDKWRSLTGLTTPELKNLNQKLLHYLESYSGYPLRAHEAINSFVLAT